MEFEPFPKIPRLNRDIVVTEKLDGTNAAVIIEEVDRPSDLASWEVEVDGKVYSVGAQSRKRLIQPNTEERKGSDNHGFAAWVAYHAQELVRLLGPGRHFGEWWGQGIQGRYGDHPRTFSLFNPDFHFLSDEQILVEGNIDTVPVLYRGPFSQPEIVYAVHLLEENGSVAAEGCKAEGVIVYHTASRGLFKVTCENDEVPKEVAVREAEKVAANGGGKVASIHWGGDGV